MAAIVCGFHGIALGDDPATVAAASQVIDLATFPLVPGGTAVGPRRLANLSYSAPGSVRDVFGFQKKTLEMRGWKEAPGGFSTDESSSGTFRKQGFTLSVAVTRSYQPGATGQVDVLLSNLGNVDLSKLPVPPGSKLIYAFPASVAYVTDAGVKETAESLAKLFATQGWEPYGSAGDARFFKNNAIRVSASTMVAPAQGGKTMIQLSAELLSADLPAPSDALQVAYADTTKTVTVDTGMSSDALAAFYRQALGKMGWKPTTETPAKVDFHEVVIFRNAAKDIATLKMQTVDGKLRATLRHQTAAELAEVLETARANEAKREAEAKKQSKMQAETARKAQVEVAITVPETAKNVKRDDSQLEFTLASGTAKRAVNSLRAELVKSGWKESSATLEALAGNVILEKKGGARLSIVYVDAGIGEAEVTISTFGAKIAGPNEK